MEEANLGIEEANLHEESDDLFRVTQPGEVLRLMKGIQREQSFVTLALPQGRKVTTMVLDVDSGAGHFLYDSGRSREETQAVLSAGRIHFRSTFRGVPVRFTTPSSSEASFDGSPALRSPLPVDMLYLQRREHFRTKFLRSYGCTARLANGQPITLDMKDISIGGVGLQSDSVTPEMLPVGSMLEANLNFLELGKLEVTLLVTSYRRSENQGRVIHLYGCHLWQLSRSKEAIVQKLVFSLEQLNRPDPRLMNR
jgi:c-di-GMP-binding flagellar brake protein YcgR